MALYQITLSYACFGIVVQSEVIVDAAPIARWSIGHCMRDVMRFYAKRGGSVTTVTEVKEKDNVGK